MGQGTDVDDEDLQVAVTRALAADLLVRIPDIAVEVTGGVVTLRGTAADERASSAATADAGSTVPSPKIATVERRKAFPRPLMSGAPGSTLRPLPKARLSALRLPLFVWRPFCLCRASSSGAKTRRENGDVCFPHPHAVRGRGTTRSVVEGASDSTFHFRRKRFVEARAPSTALCAVPLSRYRGEGCRSA